MELRSHNCRCVPPGSEFYIITSGNGKNRHGVHVAQVLGTVVFQGNVELSQDQVQAHFNSHLVPEADFKTVGGKWKKIIGWKVSDAKELTPHKWVKWNSQETEVSFL